MAVSKHVSFVHRNSATPAKRSFLGKTGLSVTGLCVGTSALGSFPSQYGYEVSEQQAIATIHHVLEGPINFIDTSNEYGNGGDSERRIGAALAAAGGLPDGFVLATKVDPIVGSTDFSEDRVRPRSPRAWSGCFSTVSSSSICMTPRRSPSRPAWRVAARSRR